MSLRRLHPNKYISVQIDGMDQKKTNLPHYYVNSKAAEGMKNPLGTHVVGAVTFGAPYPLTVWIDYAGRFANDTNLLVTQLHDLLTATFRVRDNPSAYAHLGLSQSTKRPEVLYLQMDNASPNKSIGLLTFCAMLVWKGVFRKVSCTHILAQYTCPYIQASCLTCITMPSTRAYLEVICVCGR